MKIRHICIIVLLLLLNIESYSQLPSDYGLYGLWTKRAAFGSNGNAEISTSIIDEDGNVYLSGKFTGTLNFADDLCHPSMSSVDETVKGKGLFLIKLNDQGEYQWHTVYEIEAGTPDLSVSSSHEATIYDYKDGKLLLYGRLVYYGTMSTIGMKTTLHDVTGATGSATYSKPTNSANQDRFYFQFLHVIDVTDGSTELLLSPFSPLTQNLIARFQNTDIHVMHMGWDTSVYNDNNSIVSIFDAGGNQVGSDTLSRPALCSPGISGLRINRRPAHHTG
ncbi:MAG: hypothetical protein LBV74_06575 [Tannerella sp.]|jgi:hypothetical protein|nr:hypothetical protein [Tannerella sp.]